VYWKGIDNKEGGCVYWKGTANKRWTLRLLEGTANKRGRLLYLVLYVSYLVSTQIIDFRLCGYTAYSCGSGHTVSDEAHPAGLLPCRYNPLQQLVVGRTSA
jgi:hypothetical protein